MINLSWLKSIFLETIMRTSNLTIDEVKILARRRNVDRCQIMLWEQIEDLFGTPTVPTSRPLPKLSSRLKHKPRPAPVLTLRPRPTPMLKPTIVEFEKIKMTEADHSRKVLDWN